MSKRVRLCAGTCVCVCVRVHVCVCGGGGGGIAWLAPCTVRTPIPGGHIQLRYIHDYILCRYNTGGTK